jgi:hypothetical protein
MPSIRDAHLYAFYLFDIAETIELGAIPALIPGPAVAARLAPKPATPAYVQYEKPPLSFDGEAVGVPEIDSFRVRVRVYDYGVISVRLSQGFAGSWSELVALGQTLVESAELEQQAERLAHTVAGRLKPATAGYRDAFLSEDYLVYAINELDEALAAEELVRIHGDDIAAMLRGERRLSTQERDKILGHNISYLADDLVVPTWNAAFVFDTASGTLAALEILEFANSQLLEFRYYDALLDSELGALYARLQRPKRVDRWIGSRHFRTAQQVNALFIDVNELTDRTENALKFIGDIYAVRLFRLVADRLGLETWKANVQEKLKTLDDIARFALDQSAVSRGQFLEITIVLILILELGLVLLGVMK